MSSRDPVAAHRRRIVAGRRHLPPLGPDGAPRADGLDLRWSADYLYITSLHADVRPYLWPLLAAAWDQGARQHADGKMNPFWRDEPLT
jgi:hypothetical protein